MTPRDFCKRISIYFLLLRSHGPGDSVRKLTSVVGLMQESTAPAASSARTLFRLVYPELNSTLIEGLIWRKAWNVSTLPYWHGHIEEDELD